MRNLKNKIKRDKKKGEQLKELEPGLD